MKIRLNTHYLALEGIPALATLLSAAFLAYAFMADFVHGVLANIVCAMLLLLCMWSMAYGEYQTVKGKVIKFRFAVFQISFFAVLGFMIKLYCMQDASWHEMLPYIFLFIGSNIVCFISKIAYKKQPTEAQNK